VLLRATAPVQNIRHARVCFRSECTASPIARPSPRNRLFVSTEETQSTLVQGRQYSAMSVKELRMSTILTRNAPSFQRYAANAFRTVMDILRSTATYHSRPFPTIIEYCTSVADTASFNVTKIIKRKDCVTGPYKTTPCIGGWSETCEEIAITKHFSNLM
jgi:hypothetical protein